MRIVMATEFIPPKDKGFSGGAEARTYYLAKALSKKHDVTMVSSYLPGTEREEEIDGVPTVRVGPMREYTQRGSFVARRDYIRSLARTIPSLEPDIVDGSGFVSWDGSFKAARASGARAVMSVMEVWRGEWVRNMGLFNGMIGNLLERRYFARPYDRYVSISKFTRDKMVKVFDIPPEKIDVIYCGVDMQTFDDVMVKDKYPEPTLCTVCRLVHYKRVQDVLRAMALLSDSHPTLRYKIVGRGKFEGQLNKLARELGLTDRVEFLGRVKTNEELIRIMKRSHVFVLPSIVEGFGMVVLEAMACRVPYVASAIPPVREVTQGGKGGYLFNPMDERDLANKLDQALASKTDGHDFVVENYRWESLAEELERVYLNIGGNG